MYFKIIGYAISYMLTVCILANNQETALKAYQGCIALYSGDKSICFRSFLRVCFQTSRRLFFGTILTFFLLSVKQRKRDKKEIKLVHASQIKGCLSQILKNYN